MGRVKSPECPECEQQPTQRLYRKKQGRVIGFAWHCSQCETMWKQQVDF